MIGRGKDRPKPVSEALSRLSSGDEQLRERERLGALIAILLAVIGMALVDALPVAPHLRLIFLFVAFCFAAVVGLTVKRWLDDRYHK